MMINYMGKQVQIDERFEVWDVHTRETYVVHRLRDDAWSVSIRKSGEHAMSYVTDDEGAAELYTTMKRST